MMKRLFPVVALAAALSTPALAGDFYVGADLGASQYEMDKLKLAIPPGSTIDKRDLSWSMFGGYSFNPYVAVEAGYRNFGEGSFKYQQMTGSVKSYSLSTAVRGSLPINDQVALTGHLGLSHTVSKLRVRVPELVDQRAKHDRVEGFYGVGARFAIDKQLAVRTDYSHYAKSRLNNLSAGLEYRF
ncbi:outer membrane beta-barrel protein [Chitinimonas lacunae]|uniref:Outer membrane beta-barrel protein n=1 Tax=Chitinimonas lacunae TaxID=1963018 RepID=A0ABV8MW07_9NEIS